MKGSDSLVSQSAGDFIGDGFEMRFGGAGANEEEIRHGRNAAHIKDHGVLGFLVEGDLAAEFGQIFGGEPAIALH